MFIRQLIKRNRALVDVAHTLHLDGIIQPDTYVIDIDRLLKNAQQIKAEADKYGVGLYYMTKQIGRNPYIAKRLDELGYLGAVAVDYREALQLTRGGAKLAHIGHLVQVPDNLIEQILTLRPQVITVYSLEKAKKINEVAKKINLTQGILIKLYDEADSLYPGQESGLPMAELADYIKELKKLTNLKIEGITHFPCFLFNEKTNKLEATHNVVTVKKIKTFLESQGIEVRQTNLPSTTISENVRNIFENGGNIGEPGHGLTGTTPYNAYNENAKEVPAMVYISEVSHKYQGQSYIYGGGHYRRSHLKEALVLNKVGKEKLIKVESPNPEVIDYYFKGSGGEIGDSVIMSFRTQIFVTRSEVALIKGVGSNPKLVGIYDAQGNFLRK